MKEHFRKQIMPRIENFGLTQKQVTILKMKFDMLPLER
jgi:hypothetical protein